MAPATRSPDTFAHDLSTVPQLALAATDGMRAEPSNTCQESNTSVPVPPGKEPDEKPPVTFIDGSYDPVDGPVLIRDRSVGSLLADWAFANMYMSSLLLA